MATIFTHIEPFEKRAIDHFHRCISEAKEQVQHWQDRLDFYTELLEQFEPCPNCNGSGEIAHHTAQDEVRYEKCAKCGGRGVQSATGRSTK